MSELLAKLSEPFSPEAIDWRVGATNGDKNKGIALAYIQARPVMDRLDEVVGLGNWTDTYTPIQGKDGVVGFFCTLSLKIGNDWISKMDGADTSDIEAIKGGISDAFKRAAVKWGIGRYLYDLPGVWVPIEVRGKSFVLKENPKLPDWALPKKNLKPKVESPDPLTDLLVETFAVDAPSKIDSDPLTIERACKVKSDSAGKTYGELTIGELSVRYNALVKAVKDNSLSPEVKAEKEFKMHAVKMVIDAKRNKEI